MVKTWVDRLINEYNAGKNTLETYRDKLNAMDPKGKNEDIQDECETVGGMVGDMQYALEWMRTGRRPGNRRGIERRSVYQRTALLDPELFPSLDVEPKGERLTDEERRKIADILWSLSSRERQCYLLHMSYGMSYAEISQELNVSRTTVQTFIERAKKKVFQRIS